MKSTIFTWFCHAMRALSLLVLAIGIASTASAATVKTYNFSGTFDFNDPYVTNGSVPLSDDLQQLVGATSFTGSLTFSYTDGSQAVTGWNGPTPDATVDYLEITFPGGYTLARTAPTVVNHILSDSTEDYASFDIGNFGQPTPPAVSFQPNALLDTMGLGVTFDSPPATLDTFDLTSPEISSRFLYVIVLLEDPQNPGTFGPTHNRFPISSISLVPEPSAFGLVAAGLAGLLFARRRRKGHLEWISNTDGDTKSIFN